MEYNEKIKNLTEREPLVPGKLPGIQYIKSRKHKKNLAEPEEEIKVDKQYAKDLRFAKIDIATAIPPILYLANKAEDGYEGDILAEFYTQFP